MVEAEEKKVLLTQPSLESATSSVKDDVPFTTVANLVTALLNDVKNNFVVGDSNKDVKMRKRIQKVQNIVNDFHEMSQLLVKGRHARKAASLEESKDNSALSSG